MYFCVIQKVARKGVGIAGAKEIVVTEYTSSMGDRLPRTYYSHYYSVERFERPVKWAYRISIHHNYRENGEMRKKQEVICTIGYYDIVDFGSWYGDYIKGNTLKEKLQRLGISRKSLEILFTANSARL